MVLHCGRTKPQDTYDAELHSDAIPTVCICDVALPVFFPFLAEDHVPQRRLWGRAIALFSGLRFCTSLCCTSDVRHPHCVLYNSKELSVVIHTVKHNYITSIIVIMRVLTTTCLGPTCGPSSGCKMRLDKLYYNAWKHYWDWGGGWGGTMVLFYKRSCH